MTGNHLYNIRKCKYILDVYSSLAPVERHQSEMLQTSDVSVHMLVHINAVGAASNLHPILDVVVQRKARITCHARSVRIPADRKITLHPKYTCLSEVRCSAKDSICCAAQKSNLASTQSLAFVNVLHYPSTSCPACVTCYPLLIPATLRHMQSIWVSMPSPSHQSKQPCRLGVG